MSLAQEEARFSPYQPFVVVLKAAVRNFFWLKIIQNQFEHVHNQPVFKTIFLP